MRNAGWLWVNTGVASVLGLVVWVVAARLYPPRQVGAVAATVAVANLIMVATALGLTETTIRHLQGVENQRRFVARNCLIVGGAGWSVVSCGGGSPIICWSQKGSTRGSSWSCSADARSRPR